MHVHACTRAHTHTHTHTLTQNPTNKPHKTKPAGSKTHSSNTSPPKKGGRLEQNPWGSALDLNDRLWACGKEQPKQRNSQSKGASLSGLYAFKRRLWGLKASLRTDSNDGLPGTVMQGGILACGWGTLSFLSEHTRRWQPTPLTPKADKNNLLSF